MKNYKLVNNILGWLVFIIAAIVYGKSIESTASFWDCGEFISSAYKLEVGHPPGNPIFMMVANLFTQLASNTSQIPVMVNMMSAFFSALTILFLFWTITHLTRRFVQKNNEDLNMGQFIAIMGAGLVGALAYTFSDTFWFSAVEGEVYAFSSLMTALVFWLILKWEDVADQPHSNRWLIFIAYLMGLSIAVHLLNLLCIPAIVLVYYFKKHTTPNLKGALLALLTSFAIIIIILYGLVQGLVEVAGWFELLFVNVLGMPYQSGVIFYVLLIGIVLCWSIWESMRSNPNTISMKISFIIAIILLGIPFIGSGYVLGGLIIAGLSVFMFRYKKINPVLLNTILISLLVMTIGYSSYALIMIRSTANTPMDQNSPEDVFTLRDYLAREQYGQVPLFYGQTYVSDIKRQPKNDICEPVTKDGGPIWTRVVKKDKSEKDRYFVSGRKKDYQYQDELNMFFPRMYSQDPQHIEAYKYWGNVKGTPVTVSNCGKEAQVVMKPTFFENLKFFFKYQVQFMYWRYFMWNFSGRQNDIQGNGEISNGNWITGFKFIDEKLVGPQDGLPDDIANNKGHNKYYMLPLLLGLIGLLYQGSSGKNGAQGFWVTFLLFFMTGLAIVVYLNQSPYQPRERDYAYAGSFYAFAIWIGMGVAGIFRILTKYTKIPSTIAAAAASVLCLLVPIQMVGQTWDDHDRAGRYVARDFGFNYLSTCEPNAIIFTNGDNDTFPLWYAQEVEGYRTDVRVCNLSYLRTDWYIDQMKRQAYESSPLPITWKKSEYLQGKHESVYILGQLSDQPIDLETAMEWIKSDDVRYKRPPGNPGIEIDYIPTYKVALKLDSAAIMSSGILKPEQASWIPPYMMMYYGELKGNSPEETVPAKVAFEKHELMILDMLKNNKDWKRPIYYAATVSADNYLRLNRYFSQEGIAYRIVPYDALEHQSINTEKMYDNMMNKYKWGGIDKSPIYLDENVIKMAKTFRIMFNNLAKALVEEKKVDLAEKALDKSQKVIPSKNVFYDYTALDMARLYQQMGKNDKAVDVYKKIADYTIKNIRWHQRLDRTDYLSLSKDVSNNLAIMQNILAALQELDPKLADTYAPDFQKAVQHYSAYMQRSGGRNL